MKNFYNEYEMLSAYIDGELNDEEIKYIEEKLAVSKDLQQKLNELKRIKELTQTSRKRVPESPYFEPKLINQLSSKPAKGFSFRKWAPVFGIAAATIVLMIFLKTNPKFFDTIIEEQKNRLAGLYTENLEPLFITAGLTNEDVFDFALHRKLPLDKETGQYLMLGSNEDGSEYFEIKKAVQTDSKDDFNKFVTALDLNEHQKKQIDSILEFYARDLQEKILVNKNNTVALSPKLWNYNKAIFADVMAFAKDANSDQFAKIVPAAISEIDRPELVKLAHVVRTASDSDYIFMTPDTIFIHKFKFDREKFDKEMDKMQVELKNNLKEAQEQFKEQNFLLNITKNKVKIMSDKMKDKNFEFYIDTNICRIQLPDVNFNVSAVQMPDLVNLEAQIEAATKNIRSFSVKIPKGTGYKNKFEFRIDTGDSTQKFDVEIPHFKTPIIPEEFLNDSLFINGEVFSLKGDSLANAIRMMINDSLMFNQNEFHFELKEFKKEMKKLREQMQKLEKNLEKNPKKIEKEESIEI